MMNKESEISILGFSSVASIVSLHLAESGTKHSYYIKTFNSQFLSLHPLSNPIVNGPTRKIEKQFIDNQYLSAVPSIENYVAISYTDSFKAYRNTSGKYKSETYAIDSRIRLQCFYEKLEKSTSVNLIEYPTHQDPIVNPKSSVNIVGGGEQFSKHFDNTYDLPTQMFEKKRDLFFFNLICNKSIYAKYSNKVSIFYIGNIAEILIYPFLHPTEKQTLNVTVNIIKNNQWDYFEKSMNSKTAFTTIIGLLNDNLSELATDLKNCTLADDYFNILRTTPYYKDPIKISNDNLFLGVGESITKSDPIVGQGYNSGVDMGVRLVSDLLKYNHHKSSDLLKESYSNYASKIMRYMYQINKTITQGSNNAYLPKIYDLAVNNKQLREFLFSTYDDISLYFPWLIDEEETKQLISKYKQLK